MFFADTGSVHITEGVLSFNTKPTHKRRSQDGFDRASDDGGIAVFDVFCVCRNPAGSAGIRSKEISQTSRDDAELAKTFYGFVSNQDLESLTSNDPGVVDAIANFLETPDLAKKLNGYPLLSVSSSSSGRQQSANDAGYVCLRATLLRQPLCLA